MVLIEMNRITDKIVSNLLKAYRALGKNGELVTEQEVWEYLSIYSYNDLPNIQDTYIKIAMNNLKNELINQGYIYGDKIIVDCHANGIDVKFTLTEKCTLREIDLITEQSSELMVYLKNCKHLRADGVL